MNKVSSVPLHSIHGSALGATRGSDVPGGQGRIQGAPAKHVAPPARVVEKANEGKAQGKRDPSRNLAQWGGVAWQPVQPMPTAEVLRRAHTIGAKPGRVTRGAVSVLRKPKGGAREGIVALRLALSMLEDDSGGPLLDEEYGDAERFSERVWETEDPDELVELLKAALPGIELGNPQALLAQIKGLGRNQSALMELLAGLQGIPGQGKDRQDLVDIIKEEIDLLESNGNAHGEVGVDTSDVTFFRLAHLAPEQNPLEFLSTCVDVTKKEPSTWIELLRSILRGHPSGASSSETLKGTVHNLILALGLEMRVMAAGDVKRLEVTTGKLQRVYTLHSLIDYLLELCGQVDRSIELQAIP